MAKILLVASIVVTLLTAGLGFMTKAKVDTLQTNLKRAEGDLKTTQGTLDKTKGDLKKTTSELADAQKQVEEQKGQLSTLQTSVDTEKKRAEEATTKLTAKETEIAELNKKLADSATGTTPGAPAPDALRVAELETQLNRAVAEASELKAVQEQMNTRVKDAEERLQRSESEVKRYQSNIARQGLTGRVLAVNQGWNFVVLDVGDRQGAAVNAPLLVMRGGEPIARLKITSVEPSTSIADVIPGSMNRGAAVQPGDRVVFSGRQGQPGPASAQPQPQPQQAQAEAAPQPPQQ